MTKLTLLQVARILALSTFLMALMAGAVLAAPGYDVGVAAGEFVHRNLMAVFFFIIAPGGLIAGWYFGKLPGVVAALVTLGLCAPFVIAPQSSFEWVGGVAKHLIGMD